jgi:hypothetical protein
MALENYTMKMEALMKVIGDMDKLRELANCFTNQAN